MQSGNLKVLMISSDRNIGVPGSAVAERMKEYGALVEELHIVLLSDKSHGLGQVTLGPNVWVYPTNSSTKYFRPRDAAKMGKKLVYERGFVRGQSVITAQDPFECGWAALKVKSKWRLALEVQLHTDPFSPYFSGFLNNFRKRLARKVLKNADSIRVVAEYLRERVRGLSDANISVLPIYVDRERIESGKIAFDLHGRTNWHFVILVVARLAPEKNLTLALEVLARVRAKYQSTGLAIVGSGPEERRLKALAKRLGVEQNVAFEGWQESLASYYRTANVFLQTSVFEGYGLALVEAGLLGLPVVTTPVGLALELEHGKDAYIYPAGSPELFAQGIIELIESNDKRENLKINMKHTLDSKLISKEEYLRRMLENWYKTAERVQPNK